MKNSRSAVLVFFLIFATFAIKAQSAVNQWYYVNMNTATPECIALPVGLTPQQSLAENAKSGTSQIGSDTTKEGQLQVFASKSGSRYAFTNTVNRCQSFRRFTLAAIEQTKLSNNADWLVADGPRNTCVPLSKLFPQVGKAPAAHVPVEAERAADEADMRPELKFLSPRFASLTVMYPNKETTTFSIFAKRSECTVYVSTLHEVMKSSSGTLPGSTSSQRTGFGMYTGETANLKVGIETKPGGTALVVVNKQANEFTFEPLKISIHTGKTAISPCTVHLLSLQGLGAATVVSMRAKSTEGYLLGACPSYENDGKMASQFVIRGAITKVVIGGVEVPMHPDS